MSVGQNLAMLKIRSTSVTFLSLCDLEAAPEEAMQLRRLIKSLHLIGLNRAGSSIWSKVMQSQQNADFS